MKRGNVNERRQKIKKKGKICKKAKYKNKGNRERKTAKGKAKRQKVKYNGSE